MVDDVQLPVNVLFTEFGFEVCVMLPPDTLYLLVPSVVMSEEIVRIAATVSGDFR